MYRVVILGMVDEVEQNATLLLINPKNNQVAKHINLIANASTVFPIDANK